MADDASAVGAGTGHSDRAVVGTDPTAARANPHLAADEVVPRGHGDPGRVPWRRHPLDLTQRLHRVVAYCTELNAVTGAEVRGSCRRERRG